MPDIFGGLEHEWEKLTHREPPPGRTVSGTAIAQALATMAPAGAATTEDPMSLTTLTDDVKNDLTEGLTYVEGLVGRLKDAAPGIISTTEAVGGSTIGKLAESLAGAVLPQPAEEILVSLARDLAAKYGTPAATAAPAQAAPATPAAPAPVK